MCFVTLAAVGGAVASAAGTVMGGIAAGNAADYQAKVAENNKQIALQNANYAEQAGAAKQEQEGMKAAERSAEVKTALAANNVDVNTGSALDVEAGETKKGALDQATVANNAELTAYGYRSQAEGYEAQAGLDKATAEQAPVGAAIGAAGSLLSSASGIGFKWTGGGGGDTSPYKMASPAERA